MNNQRKSLGDVRLRPAGLSELVTLIGTGKITGKIGKEILPELLESWDGTVLELVRAKGMEAISDPEVIRAMVAKVLAANEDKVADYRGGKTKLLGFFVGMVMKESNSRADPQLAQALTEQMLNDGGAAQQ